MHRTAFVLVALVACLALAGCGGATGEALREVTGKVTAGPTCPVVQDPPDPSCEDRPVSNAELVIEDPGGREVARVRSGSDGTFRLRLAAGDYRVVPQPVEGLLGTAAPVDLTVPESGDPPNVSISYDTGIR